MFNYPFLTRKERDVETGLDYFLARYYSSQQGRFTSPDEFSGGPDELYTFAADASNNPTFYANVWNPQSLNKYQYSYNNPLRYVDPDGHDTTCSCQKGPTDQTLIDDGLAIIETVAKYTGIAALADALRRYGPAAAKAVLDHGGQSAMQQDMADLRNLRQEDTSRSSRPGQKGNQDHQDEVAKQADKAREEAQPGERVLENRKVQGVDSRRIPDVQTVDANGRTRSIVEVERRPNSSRNKNRENEYNDLGIPNKTIPLNVVRKLPTIKDLLTP